MTVQPHNGFVFGVQVAELDVYGNQGKLITNMNMMSPGKNISISVRNDCATS